MKHGTINNKIKMLAQQFKNTTNFLYLGRGYNFPVALLLKDFVPLRYRKLPSSIYIPVIDFLVLQVTFNFLSNKFLKEILLIGLH